MTNVRVSESLKVEQPAAGANVVYVGSNGGEYALIQTQSVAKIVRSEQAQSAIKVQSGAIPAWAQSAINRAIRGERARILKRG